MTPAIGNTPENSGTQTQFEPEAVLHFWQQGTTRMMRVNELVMRNIMNTVKRQTELGQELLQHHLTALQPALNGESSASPPGFAKAQLEHNLHRMERMVTEMC